MWYSPPMTPLNAVIWSWIALSCVIFSEKNMRTSTSFQYSIWFMWMASSPLQLHFRSSPILSKLWSLIMKIHLCKLCCAFKLKFGKLWGLNRFCYKLWGIQFSRILILKRLATPMGKNKFALLSHTNNLS